jgi:hypothetical protein
VRKPEVLKERSIELKRVIRKISSGELLTDPATSQAALNTFCALATSVVLNQLSK